MPTPEEAIEHFDIFSEEVGDYPAEIFGHARQACPVIHAEVDGGYYIFTRYQDGKAILSDPKTFPNGGWGTPRGKFEPPISVDGDEHRDYRMLLNRFFSYRALEPHQAQIRKIAAGLVDSWVDRGRVDFMSEFASPYTATVVSNVVFNDPDASWSIEPQRLQSEVAPAGGVRQVFETTAIVAQQKLDERRASGESIDDPISALIEGKILGRPLTESERVGTLSTLFLGGLNTTRGLLGGTMHHIARNPALEEVVRNVHWLDDAVDEFVRDLSPVTYMSRVVTKPTQVGSVALQPGDHLLVSSISVNHDESVFGDDPYTLDIERDKNPHLGFGYGVHRCLGLTLARLQFAVGMQEVFKRITNVRLVRDVQYTAGIARVPATVEIAFDRR
jgi:cytochrome P450